MGRIFKTFDGEAFEGEGEEFGLVDELDGEEVRSEAVVDDVEALGWVFDTFEGAEESGGGGGDVAFCREVRGDDVAVEGIESGVVVAPAAGVALWRGGYDRRGARGVRRWSGSRCRWLNVREVPRGDP
jgi:hypothetical protein